MDIPLIRLYNQHLLGHKFNSVVEMVRHFGAVQAQEYLPSFWSVAMRMKKVVESDIEKALDNKEIIRTWPMRGTLHLVPSEDAKWMLKFLTPRIHRRMASYFRKEHLGPEELDRAKDLLIKNLEGGNSLTRKEIYEILERNGIKTKSPRGLFILGELSQNAVLCFGSRKGAQQTFVLFDEWVKKSKDLSEEETLKELAIRYFRSHGPATIKDFMSWTYLNTREARSAIEFAGQELISEKLNDQEYWFSSDTKIPSKAKNTVFLLPSYDEYTVAYKDRTTILDKSIKQGLNYLNGFTNTILVNGMVAGMWRRSVKRDQIEVVTRLARKFTSKEQIALKKAAEEYQYFTGKNVILVEE